MRTTKYKTNSGFALYDHRKKDFVPVGGQILHANEVAIEDYLASGSEWIDSDQMETIVLKMYTDVHIRLPAKEAPADLVDLPEDL